MANSGDFEQGALVSAHGRSGTPVSPLHPEGQSPVLGGASLRGGHGHPGQFNFRHRCIRGQVGAELHKNWNEIWFLYLHLGQRQANLETDQTASARDRSVANSSPSPDF